MLNEERIKLMTKMAAYEEKEGKENVIIGNYFRSDYIEMQVLKSFFAATIAFAIIIGAYTYYNFEALMHEVYKMDLIDFGKSIFMYYGIFVAAYCIIAYIVYSYRYSKVKKSMKNYYYHLRQLSAMYDIESRK